MVFSNPSNLLYFVPIFFNKIKISYISFFNRICPFKKKTDFEVKEGGENFSSGQLQLLCMARAILRKSSIIVLDEATSALDASTEKSLLKAISTDFENKTVIIIAVNSIIKNFLSP